MLSKALLSAVAGAAAVSAHGYVSNIVINGVSYAGYDVTTDPYMSTPPTVVGWSTTATDLGYVGSDSYNSSDIICSRGSSNAKGHAQVAAGDDIFLQWTTWPESHKGPVLSYLASCGDSGCESVDKTALEFFKIDEKGLIDGSGSPGTYASDQLEANGQGWMVNVPSTIKPGFYVLRHEIIALHSAGTAGAAQNYPQCINLEITGTGTDVPTGTLGTELYSESDAGILVNIYTATSTYVIPGPTMYSGASELATQTTSAISATGTATTGTALASAAAAGTTSAAVVAAAAAGTTSASTVAAAATTSVAAAASSAAPNTPTTFATATRPASTFSTAVPNPTAFDNCKAVRTHTKIVTVTV